MTPYVPYPGIAHAGGVFLYELLRRVAREHDVCLVAPALKRNLIDPSLVPEGVDVRVVPLAKGAESRFLRTLCYPADLITGLTPGYMVLRAFKRDPTLPALFREADLIEVQWSPYLSLVPHVRAVSPGTPMTALALDVYTQVLQRRSEQSSSVIGRTVSQLRRRQMQVREPDLLNRCDAVFAFSAKDVGLLSALGVEVPLHVLDPFVRMPAAPQGPFAEGGVLFVGALDRSENVDGIEWFLDEVWPVVREGVPGATITIAGANPPVSLTSRAADEIIVTGYVDDLDPFYREARLVVAPLFSGSGLKFKVPQAMAYALPVVTTPTGAEGILERSEPSIFATVTADPGETARSVIRMLTDLGAARAIGERARAWVAATYDFDASVARLLKVYATLTSR